MSLFNDEDNFILPPDTDETFSYQLQPRTVLTLTKPANKSVLLIRALGDVYVSFTATNPTIPTGSGTSSALLAAGYRDITGDVKLISATAQRIYVEWRQAV